MKGEKSHSFTLSHTYTHTLVMRLSFLIIASMPARPIQTHPILSMKPYAQFDKGAVKENKRMNSFSPSHVLTAPMDVLEKNGR